MGITEIAGQTGLSPSDVHRVVSSLKSFGYMQQNPRTRKYQLGLELLKLGHLVHERLDLRELARPFMRRLSEAAQATANLAILDLHETEVIFIEQVDSPREIQITLRVGARIYYPHATSVGKVLVAHLDKTTALRVLKKRGMRKSTKNTIASLTEFWREMETVRLQGYATDREESCLGAYCIGAPVRNHAGDVVAALSVSMMAAHLARDDEPRVVALVKETAAGISKALGQYGSC